MTRCHSSRSAGPEILQYFVQTKNRRITGFVGAFVVRVFVNDALVGGNGARRLPGFGINLAEQEKIVRNCRVLRKRQYDLFVVIRRFQIIDRRVARLRFAMAQLRQFRQVRLQRRHVFGAFVFGMYRPEVAVYAVTRHEVFLPGADFARKVAGNQGFNDEFAEHRRAAVERVVDDERFERRDAVEVTFFTAQVLREPFVYTVLPFRFFQTIHMRGERLGSIHVGNRQHDYAQRVVQQFL